VVIILRINLPPHCSRSPRIDRAVSGEDLFYVLLIDYNTSWPSLYYGWKNCCEQRGGFIVESEGVRRRDVRANVTLNSVSPQPPAKSCDLKRVNQIERNMARVSPKDVHIAS
jgi:hypothetical protein